MIQSIKQIFFSEDPFRRARKPQSFLDLMNTWDVFYVCFDEPNREEHWQSTKEMIPHAQKVEGVVGFDQALKTCAQLAKTSHFFVIDGDNLLLPARLDHSVDLRRLESQWVLSWSSLNTINGLTYGNGGLKLWPKKVALSIRSHESAEQQSDPTDYCFLAQYYLMDDFVSETRINKTPEQAFRAGLREGVKMSLSWGKQVSLNKDNFETQLGRQNRLRLKVWCEVGADVSNGLWAILGARVGLKLNVIDAFNYSQINSYEWIENYRKTQILDLLKIDQRHHLPLTGEDLKKITDHIHTLGESIQQIIPLELKLLSPEESATFKSGFVNPKRSGLLKPE